MATQNSDGTWSATIKDAQGKERVFTFGKWGAEKSVLTFADLTRMASYGAADAFKMLNDANKDTAVGVFLGMLLKGIGDGLGTEPKQTLRLLKQFCCDNVNCDGNAMSVNDFDLFFRDDIMVAFEVAKANMEAQYSGLFKRLTPHVALLRAQLTKISKPFDPKT